MLSGCPSCPPQRGSLYSASLRYDQLPYPPFSSTVDAFMHLYTSKFYARIFQIHIFRQSVKHSFQYAINSPFGKVGILCFPGAIGLRQCPPLCTASANHNIPFSIVWLSLRKRPHFLVFSDGNNSLIHSQCSSVNS